MNFLYESCLKTSLLFGIEIRGPTVFWCVNTWGFQCYLRHNAIRFGFLFTKWSEVTFAQPFWNPSGRHWVVRIPYQSLVFHGNDVSGSPFPRSRSQTCQGKSNFFIDRSPWLNHITNITRICVEPSICLVSRTRRRLGWHLILPYFAHYLQK
jgi:hypothetical protein